MYMYLLLLIGTSDILQKLGGCQNISFNMIIYTELYTESICYMHNIELWNHRKMKFPFPNVEL